MVVGFTQLGRRVALALYCCACIAAAPARAGDFIFADGFDIALDAAYFVSPAGQDTDPGTRVAPFQSITKGIAAAAADVTRRTVIVATGTYGESVALADGVSVYGQYSAATWARSPENPTVIDASTALGPHLASVTATGIVAPTTFDGFVIFGGINAAAGGNSYAIYVAAASANLHISHNVIFAGRGGPGTPGAAGPDGSDGTDGVAYSSVLDSFVATGTGFCNASNNRVASGAGVLVCADLDNISGGNGGGNNCTPAFATQNSTALSPATAGQPASAGAGGGGTGTRGFDASFNGSICTIGSSGGNPLPLSGGDGADGGAGANTAAGVPGCTTPLGTIVGNHWAGGAAATGSAGTNGAGGGGGGAGGGAFCSGGTCSKDELGGHGGGGASGGCAGAGGGAGGPGGGAFAIFVVGGTAPAVVGNLLFLGDGGDAGNGGNGGVGGLGGDGTQGGQSGALFCTGAGGRGGNGGNGGHGAGGGGGCGGASFGIYTSGIGTPNYCTTANNTGLGGFAGAAGAGGLSIVNPGGAGQPGVLATCSFH